MIQTTPEHIALLKSRQFYAVDLYAITFIDGTTIRYSGDSMQKIWNGYTYAGGGPLFKRGETKIVRGLEADSLSVEITPKPTDLLLGISFQQAVRNGILDGARFSLFRAHSATPADPIAGAILRFSGSIEEIHSDLTVSLTVKSDLLKLDAPIPKDCYQPGCSRTLYDIGCGVLRSAYQQTASAQSGSTRQLIKTSGLSGASGYFTGGEVRCISGQNAGSRRSIKLHSGGDLQLSYPLINPVAVGDSFQVWPGCAHTWDECKVKFSNGNRFNGQPFVPAPETAL